MGGADSPQAAPPEPLQKLPAARRYDNVADYAKPGSDSGATLPPSLGGEDSNLNSQIQNLISYQLEDHPIYLRGWDKNQNPELTTGSTAGGRLSSYRCILVLVVLP